ncbi:MAG: GDP-mannose 4,6-dehydratase, partial [Spartobacteria bacterium]
NYGPYQFPEKLIPLMIIKALNDQPLPVYGDGLNVRDWIHVEDHCAAIVAALFKGQPGQVYNFGGDGEMVNLEVVRLILDQLGKPHSLISFVTDRLGHDRRYAIDSSFAKRELEWQPLHQPREGLAATVAWYVDHRDWWQTLLERTERFN